MPGDGDAGDGRCSHTRAVRGGGEEEQVARLVALGRALSDPIRVRMLGVLDREGWGPQMCDLLDLGVPVAGEEDYPGICVCEFVDYSYGWGSQRSPTTSASSRRPGWCGRNDAGSGASIP